MTGRPVLRLVAMMLASLQLVAPAIAGLADGWAVRDAVAAAVPHVESDGTTGCPQVHPPDCALCRYLSSTASLLPGVTEAPPRQQRVAFDARASASRTGTTAFLPDGRAPPLG